ncbi:MAG: hypothetical protein EXX96DRAFT_573654 [Benjaminiella poitrasii]|nr:MAG: hypothetical protein EXX96DRAFT_573654 [Benjaminiella poitrasii]
MELPKLSIINSTSVQESLTKTDSSDAVIVFFSNKDSLSALAPSTQRHLELDPTFGDDLQLVIDSNLHERLLTVPTGSLTNDFDDVRRFKDAAYATGQRALKMGIRRPVICFADVLKQQQQPSAWTFSELDDYERALEVTMLGFLEAEFEPIDVRRVKQVKSFESLTFVNTAANEVDVETLIKQVSAMEAGRRVCKDIGNPDPEIMSPINIAKYIQEQFAGVENVKVSIMDDIEEIKKNYPLAHAVTRASLAVERHHPRFVHFEYKSPDQSQVKENLYFVGKGVTYDTGGADIKCSGHMRDMSRDKCGAAAVAGFFKTIALLNPTKVNVTGGLALVRNSVGPDMYVSDEVIVSRNGTRVLVGNTDAEGRMVMTDLLCEFKERVLANQAEYPQPSLLFTCATLTGHAIRAYDGYGISLDNGVARQHKVSRRIFDAGHVFADPFEISTLRREDVTCVRPGRSSEDLVSANDQPSTMTNRGHQYPAGFMLQASGLDKHGIDAEVKLGYTHVDIAGSAETTSAVGWSLPRVTGSPILALSGAFLL